MNRREFLTRAAAVPLASSFAIRSAADDAAAVPPIPPFDAARARPADFSDADLDMPYNIAYFARIANAVKIDVPDKGFINTSAGGGAGNLHPYNARIMESILTLAWFYASQRKWNQYYANKALRGRLELALEYWCNMQSPEGKFSEHGPQQWSLGATTAAAECMAETLRLLKTGPAIAPDVHARAIDCCRKALRVVLDDPDFVSRGKSDCSQYSSIFAGGAAFLAIYPDAALADRLKTQAEASASEFESPCGYFYEADGPDLGATLEAHHESLRMAYSYWRGTHFGDILLGEEDRWGKWLSYNLLPEPDQAVWTANCSIETTRQRSIVSAIDTPLADKCVIMRAFATAPERRDAQLKAARDRLNNEWPKVEAMNPGDGAGLSPYRFLERAHYDWHPTADQISEARKMLRPVNEYSFAEQLKDSREPIVFTYVRRPSYYAAFAAAPKVITKQQRLGLTLMWTPAFGALLQSQTASAESAWGTFLGEELPVEALGFDAEYGLDTQDNTGVRYALPGGGSKRITFALDRILVSVEREGQILERIPVFDAAIVLSNAEYSMRPAPVSSTACGPEAACQASPGPVPGKSLSLVELKATGRLEYEIRPVA